MAVDFAATGLYQLADLIGQTRVPVAALSRITKEFVRDPGFLLGRGMRGYGPECPAPARPRCAASHRAGGRP